MRRSPGSPSQMSAALLRRGPRTWRSRQLTLALIWPPTNHFACGGCQSSTRVPGPRPFELARPASPRTPRDRARPPRRCRRRATTALRAEGGRRRKRAVFAQEVVDLGVSLLVGHAGIIGGVGSRCSFCHRGLWKLWMQNCKRLPTPYPPSVVEARADPADEIGVGDGAEAQERAVVLDRRRRVAALVGDDREVVVRAGVARIDGERAAQQVARVGDAARGLLHQREVDERLDVARVGRERDAELGGGGRRLAGAHQRDAEVVVRLHVPADRSRSPAETASSHRRAVRAPRRAGRGCCALRRSRRSARAARGSARARCRSRRRAGSRAPARSDPRAAARAAAAAAATGSAGGAGAARRAVDGPRRGREATTSGVSAGRVGGTADGATAAAASRADRRRRRRHGSAGDGGAARWRRRRARRGGGRRRRRRRRPAPAAGATAPAPGGGVDGRRRRRRAVARARRGG